MLNLLLKDDRAGGRVELRSGTHAAGDGREYGVAANAGLPLGRAGFANLSLEYGESGSTDRNVQRADAAGLIATGNGHVRDPAQRWGASDVGDDLKLFANLGHVFANGVQAYGQANYARRDVLTFFYYRNPNTRGGAFSNDGGRTLLVGDVLAARGDGSASCPAVAIEDFGATLNGKLSGRVPLSARFALRPAPDARAIRQRQRRRRGRRRPVHAHRRLLRIDLSDRLTLSRLFALDAQEVGGLLAEGITSAGNLANFRFFTTCASTTGGGRRADSRRVGGHSREMSEPRRVISFCGTPSHQVQVVDLGPLEHPDHLRVLLAPPTRRAALEIVSASAATSTEHTGCSRSRMQYHR